MGGLAVRGSRGKGRLRRHVQRLGAPAPTADAGPVTEAHLAGLPDPAQRFLRAAEVVGRPRDRSLVVRFDAQFRLRPGQRFQRCQAWQYNTAAPISRVFSMRLDLAGVLPMLGVDSWVAGRGRLHGTLLGIVPVADGSGPEFDVGELVTWLDDACLLAPSMLLVPAVTWTAVDDRSFDVTVTESGVTATARVTLDEHDRPADVSTTDRWVTLPSGLVRARWTTPVDGWTRYGSRWLPTGGRAVWHLPDGPYEYARGRFAPETLQFDVDLTTPAPERRSAAATSVEARTPLPGDELVPEPALSTTLGVDVAAPAERVWPWLVQIGQDRGGMYSYDWLENLLGMDIRSTDRLDERWQELAVGDCVRLVPRGWCGVREGFALPVARVDPGRALVLSIAPPQFPWTAVWSFHVVPTGPTSCRLLSRSREADRGRAARAGSRLMFPITYVMTRRMLLGIRDRAERTTAGDLPGSPHSGGGNAMNVPPAASQQGSRCGPSSVQGSTRGTTSRGSTT